MVRVNAFCSFQCIDTEPAHVAKCSVHPAPCAVEHDAPRCRGSKLGPGAFDLH